MLYDFLEENIRAQFVSVRDLKTGPRGQVTLLRHRKSGTQIILRSFQGSAAVYQKLLTVNCSNLPRVAEVAEKDGHVLVLEEYIQGDPLSLLLEDGRTLPPKQAADIARQVCGALWVLHDRGVVHRDVKPGNVLLRGGTAVLIDFDASRQYDAASRKDTQVLGTVGYAAPEQFGFTQTDARADIYALGVMLNVMLTGQHPSRALAKGRLGRVIQRCTMISPQHRYSSILRLMEDL